MGEGVEKTAQEILKYLMDDLHLTVGQIAAQLGNRISDRSLYRWYSGEASPQRESDLVDLRTLYTRLKPDDAAASEQVSMPEDVA